MLQDTDSTTAFESDKKLRMYYQTCRDETLREELGVKPLKKILKRLGGWPILEGTKWAHEKSFRWYNHVLKMASIGFYEISTKAFVRYGIGIAWPNSQKNVLQLLAPKMPWCEFLRPFFRQRLLSPTRIKY